MIPHLLLALHTCGGTAHSLFVHHFAHQGPSKPRKEILLLVSELLKLIFSYFLSSRGALRKVRRRSRKPVKFSQVLPYLLFSLIHFACNLLSFYNLGHVDPNTYQMFLQGRILCTAILGWLLFGKSLSIRRFVSLFIIMYGVVLKEFTSSLWHSNHMNFLILHPILSSVSGLYNEYLLRSPKLKLSTQHRNICVYGFSLILTFLYCILQYTVNDLSEDFSLLISNVYAQAMIFNSAFLGILTSFVIFYFGALVKTVSNGCEIILTAMVTSVLFSHPFSSQDLNALSLTFLGVCLYAL